MFIQESYVNRTENHFYGESDVYEAYTDNVGRLFRSLQQEFGRCSGKVHIDADGGTKDIGWVFEGRVKHSDSNNTYLREVWVTLHEQPPTATKKYHYQYL